MPAPSISRLSLSCLIKKLRFSRLKEVIFLFRNKTQSRRPLMMLKVTSMRRSSTKSPRIFLLHWQLLWRITDGVFSPMIKEWNRSQYQLASSARKNSSPSSATANTTFLIQFSELVLVSHALNTEEEGQQNSGKQ